MKAKSRFLGIDDGPFRFGDAHVPLIGVVVQAPSYIDGVLHAEAQVDGTDSTERIAAMIARSRYRDGLSMVLIDGAAVGGFNVVNLDVLSEACDLPVVTITRRPPDLRAIQRALQQRFPDWEDRWRTLTRHPVETIPTRHAPLHVTRVGASLSEVREVIALTSVRGALPEPLRIAHLIATALVRGESHGRA